MLDPGSQRTIGSGIDLKLADIEIGQYVVDRISCSLDLVLRIDVGSLPIGAPQRIVESFIGGYGVCRIESRRK